MVATVEKFSTAGDSFSDPAIRSVLLIFSTRTEYLSNNDGKYANENYLGAAQMKGRERQLLLPLFLLRILESIYIARES